MIAKAASDPNAVASLLGRWEARLKVPGLLILIFAFAFVSELVLLIPLILCAAIVYTFSGLPVGYLATRLRLPGFFLLALAVILPFWSGQTEIWRFGPLTLYLEGLLGLLLISVKFTAIFSVAVVLFATTSLSQLTLALRTFGMPWLLTDLLLFTHRYLFQLAADLQRMRTAALMRGFQGSSLASLKPLAYITGSMLVRSHDQAERVFQAMTLRGYGNSFIPLPAFRPSFTDYLLLTAAVMLSGGFLIVQHML